MPYALFDQNERLTRSFPTEQDVWDAADRADLVVTGPDGARMLEDNYEIRPCADTHDEGTDPGSDFIPS